MVHCKPLYTPTELRSLYPLLNQQKAFIGNKRAEICQILSGKDSRHLLIVGPCSIHDVVSAKEYALRLSQLSREVSDHFLLVMRAYYEKPRTKLGWKGFLYDPDLNGSNDIQKGLSLTRQLLIDLTQLEIPLAAEFLEPASSVYFDDLISWGCIGARTVTSQTHRQMASGLPMPMAFKNTTEGDIEGAVHGMISCAHAHTHVGINPEGQVSIMRSSGNDQGHLVLRGSDTKTNYDPESISDALMILKRFNLPLRLLIDCSHGNSKRAHEQQCQVFQSVISQIIEGNQAIKGILLESHLHGGNQLMMENMALLKYGVSVTDSCLDWETTEGIIRWAYHKIKNEAVLKTSRQQALHLDDFAFQKTC
mgnify:FL=1